MDHLLIRGLRSLKSTGRIRIAPITILLGENSSGKSTFLRTFPLLRQSVEVRTSEPLLWYGRLVDFGSFDESVSTFNEKKSIEIETSVYLDTDFATKSNHLYIDSSQDSPPPAICTASFRIAPGPPGEDAAGKTKVQSFVTELKIEICGMVIHLKLERPNELSSLQINNELFTEVAKASYGITSSIAPTPTFYSINEEYEEEEDDEDQVGPGIRNFESELHSYCRSWMHGRTKDNSVSSITNKIRLGTSKEILAQIKEIQADRGVWKKQILEWNEDSEDFIQLRNLLWGSRLEETLDVLARVLQREFLSTSYITPLRAAAERYYRQQGLAVNELDAKGENFAQFLRSLNSRDKENLRRWLASSLGVYVDLEDSKGHVSLYLVDDKTKSRVNLADTGFGYSQLLPIAVQLWLSQSQSSRRTVFGLGVRTLRSKLVVIEQPELHLHPRIQAKVADILAHTALTKGQPTKIVVETHSEALVNRLGKLVADKTLSPADISIVLFNKESFSGPTTVTTTEFDSNGFLKDWPLGFFSAE